MYWIRGLVISAILFSAGCKPEKPDMQQFRVSMLEALEGEGQAGLDPETKEETVATIGGDRLTLGELADALRFLPPYTRYYYSSATRMEQFLKNYILLNLCAAEAVKKGFHRTPYIRQTLLTELAIQVKNDLLSDKVRTEANSDDQVKILAERREEVWAAHLAELRGRANIEIHSDRLEAARGRLDSPMNRADLPLAGAAQGIQ